MKKSVGGCVNRDRINADVCDLILVNKLRCHLHLIPVDKEMMDQYSVPAPCRQQCLLNGQLVLCTAKPASLPLILYPALNLPFCVTSHSNMRHNPWYLNLPSNMRHYPWYLTLPSNMRHYPWYLNPPSNVRQYPLYLTSSSNVRHNPWYLNLPFNVKNYHWYLTLPSNAQLGTKGISIYIKLSIPSKFVIFNVEYLHQYLR